MLFKSTLYFFSLAAIFAASVSAYSYDDYESTDAREYGVSDEVDARAFYDEELDARDIEYELDLQARQELAYRVLSELATRRYGVEFDDLFARADVSVTLDGSKSAQVLKSSEKKNSREALGVWKVGKKFWKVFKSRSNKDALLKDYTNASREGLNMGGWEIKDGKVDGSQGFVLIMEDASAGVPFSKGASAFKAALTKAGVPKSGQAYDRMLAQVKSAVKVGLRDPQGFVKADWRTPILWTDIHTSTASQGSLDLLKVAEEWGGKSGSASSSRSNSPTRRK